MLLVLQSEMNLCSSWFFLCYIQDKINVQRFFFTCSYLNANGATDPNSAVGNTGAQILIGNIQDTRSMLSGLGVSVPVGNSDAGAYFNTEVLGAVDYGVRCPSFSTR